MSRYNVTTKLRHNRPDSKGIRIPDALAFAGFMAYLSARVKSYDMPRKSPVHYIAPSSISVTANANGSANDLAVYIARGCKIRVYSPRAGLNTTGGNFQEWTLAGRNRRLREGTKPYTIYARLPKGDKNRGYLVFVPKNGSAEAGWTDKYNYVTADTVSGLTSIWGGTTSPSYWYVRLGDVSIPENGQRTVDIDTGILGIDQFNSEWALNPDSLPLRIEFGCTVGSEDAGPTPYVYWGQSLLLTAMLKEGWTGTDIQRFDHWEITRDTGNAQADAAWSAAASAGDFRTSGVIELRHHRGAGNTDDFNSAVNTTLTVNAMERTDDPEAGGTPQYAVLKAASICIMAETWETYGLSLSSDMMTYNPQTSSYSPTGGIDVKVRATDQKSQTFLLTNKQVNDAGLVVEYAAVGVTPETWTAVSFSGADGAVAVGNIPTSAFTRGGLNVRMRNGAGSELFRTTIACLRDGEDSKEREWIFLRSTEAITFGDSGEHVRPALITDGEVDPPSSRAAGGDTPYDDTLDGWVPEGWWDEMQGTDETNCYESGSYRDFVKESGSTPAHWGPFSYPKIWSHYGHDGDPGEDAMYYVDDYGRASSRNLIDGLPGGFDNTTGWQATAPAATDTYKYIWKRSRLCNPNTTPPSYGTPSYVCLTGDDGNPGHAGEAALNVVVSPASMIVEQDINDKDNIAHAADNNLGQFSIQVLKGSTACTITSITASASRVYMSESASTGDYTGSDCRTWQPGGTIADMYLKGIGKDSQDRYYSTGQITLSITYTDPDTNTSKTVTAIIARVYVNLIGSWSEKVEGDMKTELANSSLFKIDNDPTSATYGQVIEEENWGEFYRSSTENISKLTRQVSDGKNLIKELTSGWQDNNGVTSTVHYGDNFLVECDNPSLFSPIITLELGATYCFSAEFDSSPMQSPSPASYALAADGSYQNNSAAFTAGQQRTPSWTDLGSGRYYFTFTTGRSLRMFVFKLLFSADNKLYRPQLEEGSTPTEFAASSYETSSLVKQTADNIDMSITNKLGETGINIDGNNREIHLQAQTTRIDNDVVVGSLSTEPDNDGFYTEIKGGENKVARKVGDSDTIYMQWGAFSIAGIFSNVASMIFYNNGNPVTVINAYGIFNVSGRQYNMTSAYWTTEYFYHRTAHGESGLVDDTGRITAEEWAFIKGHYTMPNPPADIDPNDPPVADYYLFHCAEVVQDGVKTILADGYQNFLYSDKGNISPQNMTPQNGTPAGEGYYIYWNTDEDLGVVSPVSGSSVHLYRVRAVKIESTAESGVTGNRLTKEGFVYYGCEVNTTNWSFTDSNGSGRPGITTFGAYIDQLP